MAKKTAKRKRKNQLKPNFPIYQVLYGAILIIGLLTLFFLSKNYPLLFSFAQEAEHTIKLGSFIPNTPVPNTPTNPPNNPGPTLPPRPASCGGCAPAPGLICFPDIQPPLCCIDNAYTANPSSCCGGSVQIYDKYYCYYKPVIYLYPTRPTLVDVSLNVPGKITVTDPVYPQGGWKNILALPDGTLYYQNKPYRELFYETDVNKTTPPAAGFVVTHNEIKDTLEKIITHYGLIGPEKEEFLDFWVPTLGRIQTPFLFISVLAPQNKKEVDEVVINPAPDTFIQFLIYVKPLSEYKNIEPLLLPESIPQRIGFTAVEWGGVVDTNITPN